MSIWPRTQIRYVAALGTGHTPSRSKPEYWENCEINWLTLADVGRIRSGEVQVVNQTEEKISRIGVENSSAVVHPAGTVVMSRTASVGYSAILGVDSATSQDYVTWTCGEKLLNKYLYWVLQGEREFIVGRMQGSTHKTIYMPDIEALTTPVPPIEQQRAIADYLDIETARIDALISKKQQLIHLLEERANSAILQFVGKADLGSPFPAAVPLKRVVKKKVQLETGGEMITAFRDGQVTTRVSRGRDGFTNSWTEGSRVQKVEQGDIVVHGLDAFSGAIGDAEAPGVCSPVYHVLSCVAGDNTFMSRMLRLLALEGYLGSFATSTRERAVDLRNWDLVGSIPVPAVPRETQVEIGNLIRSIRPLRALVQRSEVLANEKRQALITRAVTGEFQVTGDA